MSKLITGTNKKRQNKLNISGKPIMPQEISWYQCFHNTEYKTGINSSQETGDVVEFNTPLIINRYVPQSISGSTISDRYGIALAAKHNMAFEDNFKFLEAKI